jgi:hypothetical protein
MDLRFRITDFRLRNWEFQDFVLRRIVKHKNRISRALLLLVLEKMRFKGHFYYLPACSRQVITLSNAYGSTSDPSARRGGVGELQITN